MYADYLDQHT